jgi:hypothetical protein
MDDLLALQSTQHEKLDDTSILDRIHVENDDNDEFFN